jgi:hypothetical protein
MKRANRKGFPLRRVFHFPGKDLEYAVVAEHEKVIVLAYAEKGNRLGLSGA